MCLTRVFHIRMFKMFNVQNPIQPRQRLRCKILHAVGLQDGCGLAVCWCTPHTPFNSFPEPFSVFPRIPDLGKGLLGQPQAMCHNHSIRMPNHEALRCLCILCFERIPALLPHIHHEALQSRAEIRCITQSKITTNYKPAQSYQVCSWNPMAFFTFCLFPGQFSLQLLRV